MAEQESERLTKYKRACLLFSEEYRDFLSADAYDVEKAYETHYAWQYMAWCHINLTDEEKSTVTLMNLPRQVFDVLSMYDFHCGETGEEITIKDTLDEDSPHTNQ